MTTTWTWNHAVTGVVPPLVSPLDDGGAADAGAMAALVEHVVVSGQFPIFQDPTIRVAERRGGLPTLTTDDRYVAGPLPGEWVMSGCCVGGLSVSPAVDLSGNSPVRFAGRELDESELRERCRHAYATRTGRVVRGRRRRSHSCAALRTPCILGSSRSRSPSPKRFSPRMQPMMAAPGKRVSHGACWR